MPSPRSIKATLRLFPLGALFLYPKAGLRSKRSQENPTPSKEFMAMHERLSDLLASIAVASQVGVSETRVPTESDLDSPSYAIHEGHFATTYRFRQSVPYSKYSQSADEALPAFSTPSGIVVDTTLTIHHPSLWFGKRPPEVRVTVTDSAGKKLLALERFEWAANASQPLALSFPAFKFEITGVDELIGFTAEKVTGIYDQAKDNQPRLRICAKGFSVSFSSDWQVSAKSDTALFEIDKEGAIRHATLIEPFLALKGSPASAPEPKNTYVAQSISLMGPNATIGLHALFPTRHRVWPALPLPTLIEGLVQCLTDKSLQGQQGVPLPANCLDKFSDACISGKACELDRKRPGAFAVMISETEKALQLTSAFELSRDGEKDIRDRTNLSWTRTGFPTESIPSKKA